jgi:hypothetical protein
MKTVKKGSNKRRIATKMLARDKMGGQPENEAKSNNSSLTGGKT